MPSHKLSMVFCHGAWHTPDMWDRVRSLFENAGYTTYVAPLASINTTNPLNPEGFDDVASIRRTILAALQDQGGSDVVVVCHSYAGVPAGDAVKGLTEPGQGTGAVKGMVYLASFALPEGASLMAGVGGRPLAWWGAMEDGNSLPQEGIFRFYNDLQIDDAKFWQAKLRPQATKVFEVPAGFEAYRHLPSGYLICERDNAVDTAVQESMSGGGAFNLVERIDAGHSPMLSQPDETAAFIRKVVEDVVPKQT